MSVTAPDALELTEIAARARTYAEQAGALALQRFEQSLEVRFKDKRGRDPVSDADLAVESFLKEAIAQDFPEHGIISEEEEAQGRPDADYQWVLDPIDGTINFINGFPLFAVSIGVLHLGRPVVGAIFVPTNSWLRAGVFHAYSGGGAFFEDQPISVKRAGRPSPLTMLPMNFFRILDFKGPLRQRPREARNLGSIVYEMTLNACGVFQYSVFTQARIWDIAAASALVREAGGEIIIRPRGAKSWQVLDAFQPVKPSKQNPGGLRYWAGSLAAGQPELVGELAQRLRWRRRLLLRFRMWLRQRLNREQPARR